MSKFLLPHFGELDPKNLEEYYDVGVEFNGQEIQMDLNFENSSIDTKRLALVKQFIENLSTFDKRNKEYIEQDFADEDGDTVRSYIEHHLEEISKEDFSALIDFNDNSASPEIQLKNALRMVRVGLYPDSEDQFAIFDYSIDPDLTQYLVVINTNEKGDLDYMTMES